jgi:hypothetical protein
MDWQDHHLHEFTVGGPPYGDPDLDEENRVLDERTVHLRDLGLASGAHFEYAYDFGDNWQHVLEFEDEVSPAAGAAHPVCVGGECSAPPEDVGGVSGYQELLEALADPSHEEHEAMQAARTDRDVRRFSEMYLFDELWNDVNEFIEETF